MIEVSVVIPTYGRPQLLGRGLAALTRQTLAIDRFEVIVVDDGSPEPLDEVVAAVADRLDLTLLRKDNGGLSSARNHGAAHARGGVLVFMDDDIVPAEEFLEAHLAVHTDHPRAVALGSLPHPDDLEMTPFLYYLNRLTHYDLFLRFGSADAIPLPPLNGNSSIRRREFEAQGGYDTKFSSYGGEDTDMGYRLLRSGVEFVYAPRARGYHYHIKDFAAYRDDMHSSGVTMVTIVRKHPEVLERVNLDIVRLGFSKIGWKKRLQKIAFRGMIAAPIVVRGIEGLVAHLEPLGLARTLYPFYYLSGHFHYARGMYEEILRAGLAVPQPQTGI